MTMTSGVLNQTGLTDLMTFPAWHLKVPSGPFPDTHSIPIFPEMVDASPMQLAQASFPGLQEQSSWSWSMSHEAPKSKMRPGGASQGSWANIELSMSEVLM